MKATLEKAVAQYNEAYGAYDEETKSEMVNEEIVARFIETTLSEPKRLLDEIDGNTSLIGRIKDILKTFVSQQDKLTQSDKMLVNKAYNAFKSAIETKKTDTRNYTMSANAKEALQGVRYSDNGQSQNNEGRVSNSNANRRVRGLKNGTTQYSLTDSEGRTLTQEQAEFFKDSKVRDNEGNLLVVYHGTNKEFFTFEMSKNSKRNVWGEGFYFAKGKGLAYDYGKNIIEAFLNIKNPYINGESNLGTAEYIKDKYFNEMWENSRQLGIDYITNKLEHSPIDLLQFMAEKNNKQVADILKEYGYDGIIDGSQMVAFDPNQIKLIENKAPTKKDDIRYSLVIPEAEDLYDYLKKTDIVDVEYVTNHKAVKVANGISRSMSPTITNNSEARSSLRKEIAQILYNMRSAVFDKNGKCEYNGIVDNNRIVDIVIGLPAAGKSSVIVNPLSEMYRSLVIDSDMAKELLPEFNNGYGANAVHRESSEIAKQIRGQAIKSGKNIVIPIVGSDSSKVEQLAKQFKENGYTVRLHLNEVSSNTSMKRAMIRFLEEGRFIPPDVIADYGNAPTAVYEELKNKEYIYGYSRYNNDVRRGEAPICVEAYAVKRVERREYSDYTDGQGSDKSGDKGRDTTQEQGRIGENRRVRPSDNGDNPLNGKTQYSKSDTYSAKKAYTRNEMKAVVDNITAFGVFGDELAKIAKGKKVNFLIKLDKSQQNLKVFEFNTPLGECKSLNNSNQTAGGKTSVSFREIKRGIDRWGKIKKSN